MPRLWKLKLKLWLRESSMGNLGSGSCRRGLRRSTRKGTKTMARIIENTPLTAMPKRRNGRKVNKKMGYKSSARIARGQQRTIRISQSRKAAMVSAGLAPLTPLDRGDRAHGRHVVEDGAAGKPRAHAVVNGGDLAVLDQAGKLLRRD